MDAYINGDTPLAKSSNRETPTMTIAASGHNNTDLNSYLAVEFEFLHDVLEALRITKEQGVDLRVVIKVRANGYRGEYERFVQEYFPGLVNEFLDNSPMAAVFEQTDFFITIYSRLLFEASCLGFPCLYY